MKKISKLIKFITSPEYRFYLLARCGFFNSWSDEKFLKRKFKSVFGYELDLQNPRTFSEKLQWLKLHDRNPLYVTLVDKYAVKKWVADKIGKQYIIPTLGVWNSFDEIDFGKLPDQFVLKTTHNSGGVVICKDKATLDFKRAKAKLMHSLRHNYYYPGREWPYKEVLPRIIAEKYMIDSQTNGLRDYKFFCFNGQPRLCMVATDRFTESGLRTTYYDLDWNKMPFMRKYLNAPRPIACPVTYKEMLALAEKLAKNIPFVRFDFYEIDQKVYFGEMTFFPASGLERFTPSEWDKTLGDWIELTNK